MYILVVINLLNWILIIVNVLANNTLVWKIWRRKNLHTVFNLGMCFFFFWGGVFAPVMIYDYGTLLQEMIHDPETTHPDICHRIYLCRIMILQAPKVILVNIIFR